MWYQLITHECVEVCICSGTIEAYDSWKYEEKNPAELALYLKIFITALEVTDEEMQNSSHIKSLDLNKSIVTL